MNLQTMIFDKGRLLTFLIYFTLSTFCQPLYSQSTIQRNVLSTAVPFLSFNANAQSMGSGQVGVVASDLYTQNGFDQNPAMLARGKKILGFQLINYVPWLRKMVPDINLYETGYYHSVDSNNALGFSARYFSLGEISYTDDTGNVIGNSKPFDYAIGLKYAHNFSKCFSMGAGIKYVYSDLLGGKDDSPPKYHAAQAVAVDLGFDYRRDLFQNENFRLHWNAGLAFLNIGNKVNYIEGARKDFIPQTMKLGNLFTLSFKINDHDFIACDVAYQFDKLLVPTPPEYATDASGNWIPDGKGGFEIESGMNPNVSSLRGVMQSFYDAPGGYQEELREIVHQFGMESRIILADNKVLLALRSGHFYEHVTKGGRNFMTFGLGIGLCGFRLDFSYLLPAEQRHPLRDTWSISLGARFNLDRKTFFRFIE